MFDDQQSSLTAWLLDALNYVIFLDVRGPRWSKGVRFVPQDVSTCVASTTHPFNLCRLGRHCELQHWRTRLLRRAVRGQSARVKRERHHCGASVRTTSAWYNSAAFSHKISCAGVSRHCPKPTAASLPPQVTTTAPVSNGMIPALCNHENNRGAYISTTAALMRTSLPTTTFTQVSANGNDGPGWGTVLNPADQCDVVAVGGLNAKGTVG